MELDRHLLTVNAKLLRTPGIQFNPQDRSLVGLLTFFFKKKNFLHSHLNMWIDAREGRLERHQGPPAEQPQPPQVLGGRKLLRRQVVHE